MRSTAILILAATAAATLFARTAWAQLDPWEFEVYGYQTTGKGVLETEWLNSYVADGHDAGGEGSSSGDDASDQMYRTAIELSYGLTDHIEAAVYLNLARPDGAPLQYAGSKYRLRGSLFEQGQYFLDLGWYVEVEQHRVPQFDDIQWEIELKPIIEKDIGRFEIALNPKFETSLSGPDPGKVWEFGYVAGLYYNYSHLLSPGVELYGALGPIGNVDPTDEQQHYIFPIVRGSLPYGIEYNVGPGIGLTSGSDRVIVKVNLELEHFIGNLF